MIDRTKRMLSKVSSRIMPKQRPMSPPQPRPQPPTHVEDPNYPMPPFLADNPDYKRFEIGMWTYGKPRLLHWLPDVKISVGKYCSISDMVTILLSAEHRPDWVTTYPFNYIFPEFRHVQGHPASRGDIHIGHDVWIGFGVQILSGVIIGNGGVVGAGSIVSKNVEPYEIVAGNPARHIRYRFDQETIDALQEIAWWDWPLDKIKAEMPLMLSSGLYEFIAKHRPSASTAGSPSK